MNNDLATVILAAGLGTRMKSRRGKVLHSVAGRPMIEYPVGLAKALGATRVVCVLGHQSDEVRGAITKRFGTSAIEVVLQKEQRGTGHAVAQAAPLLAPKSGATHDGLLLILYGDVPLLTVQTLEKLRALANEKTLAIVTSQAANPKGYGRIVRNAAGRVERVVEEKDCSDAQRKITEVNAGIYCGPSKFIFAALEAITPNNAQGELYLTDVIERAARELNVATVDASTEEMMGVNDRVELSKADRIMRLRLAEHLMREGVTVRDPERLYLEPGITVGADSELGPGVELRGATVIGSGCKIEAGVIITDCKVGDDVHIKPYCVLSESTVGSGSILGPWAHLRPGTVLESEVHIGNFVETKKAHVGRGSKANHLSYLGDATIGAMVNVGCGTITCNYDGFSKHQTVIEDGVFIGSDTQLVAPVRVGRDAVIGAGTTVYEDVPAGALAITRTKQVNKEGYSAKRRERLTRDRQQDKQRGAAVLASEFDHVDTKAEVHTGLQATKRPKKDPPG